MEQRWPDALKESRALSKSEAAYRIMRRYLETAGFGNHRALARMLRIDPARADRALRRLEREKIIARGIRIERVAGLHSVLRELI
jgi:hypothetical protein